MNELRIKVKHLDVFEVTGPSGKVIGRFEQAGPAWNGMIELRKTGIHGSYEKIIISAGQDKFSAVFKDLFADLKDSETTEHMVISVSPSLISEMLPPKGEGDV